MLKQTKKPVKYSARKRWPGRAKIMDRYMRVVFKQFGKSGEISSAHNIGHVKRVSLYATKYAEFMGAKPAIQQQTRIAGISHDRIRDKTEQYSHEETSGRFMGEKFAKRYGKRATKRMTDAIVKHGGLPELNRVGKNIARDAVVFADKFFEANGAYIAFRRAMFMGERVDRRKEMQEKHLTPEQAAIEFTIDETKKRIKAFSDLSKIPKHLHSFVGYQVGWQRMLLTALETREPGVIRLTQTLFKEGLKKNPLPLDETIKNYQPISNEDKAFKDETMRYLRGELWDTFKALVKKPEAL